MENKYQDALEGLKRARSVINELCGDWLPYEVLMNLTKYGEYDIYNYFSLNAFKELVDKETPMKAIKEKVENYDYINISCPKCNEPVLWGYYCAFCGQKIEFDLKLTNYEELPKNKKIIVLGNEE